MISEDDGGTATELEKNRLIEGVNFISLVTSWGYEDYIVVVVLKIILYLNTATTNNTTYNPFY